MALSAARLSYTEHIPRGDPLNGGHDFSACTNLQAMIAFGWLGWITLTILLLFTVVTANRTNAWNDHVHESWSDKPLFPTTGKGFAPGPPPAMHNPRFDRPSAAHAV
ncbi:hypothetical protein Clacol_002211 [Clathrus columnatus]|uniref:Uncharacterized protein n=1 Tax=Clathrus columnatus TaxID=1419009 RepID=A0AAV5A5I0_9AGAM|nr:hypothetical protein Clacol_002211 [Clathrus columnatus]